MNILLSAVLFEQFVTFERPRNARNVFFKKVNMYFNPQLGSCEQQTLSTVMCSFFWQKYCELRTARFQQKIVSSFVKEK